MTGERIGILTFHEADNQGAVLQAYALQTFLTMSGKKAEIINYSCAEVMRTKHAKKSDGMLKYILMSAYYRMKGLKFDSFRKKRLALSESYDSGNIADACSKYNAIIAGSDQIWNLECSGNDYAYFLDFADDSVKKYSYAASMGSITYSDDEKKHIGNLLERMESISVREESSVKKLDFCGRNILVHPDPVLLLESEQWEPIMSKRLEKRKYIFVYLIQDDVNVMNTAKKYALDNNCKIINNKKSAEFIINGSPADFLSWIYYADAVFTNSFHGTAFSILFEKKLGADIALKSGKTNNRVSELLKSADSESCITGTDRAFDIAKKGGVLPLMIDSSREYLRNI